MGSSVPTASSDPRAPADLVAPQTVVRELTSDQACTTVLKVINEDPGTATTVGTRGDVSRQAAQTWLTTFHERRWIERDDNTYTPTGASAILQHQYERATDSVPADSLAYLARSAHRSSLLRAFDAAETASPRDINRVVEWEPDDGPSPSTISRTRAAFEDRGWLTRDTGGYQLTNDGKSVVETYELLLIAIEQLIDKTPTLRDLDPGVADMPVWALEDARQVVATADTPFAAVNAYFELPEVDELTFDRLRGFSSFFDMRYARALEPAIDEGKDMKFIMPGSMLSDLPTSGEEAQFAQKCMAAENIQSYMYPGTLPAGLAVFDRDRIALGARNPARANSEWSGTIYSTNDELIEWGLDLYDTYRADAEPPLQYLLARMQKYGAELFRTVKAYSRGKSPNQRATSD